MTSSGDPLSPPAPSASPWQHFYARVLNLRRRRGGSERLPGITWSVGNLHWGGGGKTPLVAEVGRSLVALGARVCVLSRGYGRQGKEPLLVSRGDGPLHDVWTVGDEPHLLARTVPGLNIAVAQRRVDAGQLALTELAQPPDVFLLDDGFSHVRLHRDLDLLAFPWADPFGGARLLPTGRLREPLSASRHAAAAVLTGVPEDERERGQDLAHALQRFGFSGAAFSACLEPQIVVAPGDAHVSQVVLVSGVARPEPVERTATACGVEVLEHLSFPDHHAYPERSLEAIRSALSKNPGASLLATSKDWGKLIGRIETRLAELRVRCSPSAGFGDWLAEQLELCRQQTQPHV